MLLNYPLPGEKLSIGAGIWLGLLVRVVVEQTASLQMLLQNGT